MGQSTPNSLIKKIPNNSNAIPTHVILLNRSPKNKTGMRIELIVTMTSKEIPNQKICTLLFSILTPYNHSKFDRIAKIRP